MRIRSHKLKTGRFDNFFSDVEDRWNYRDMIAHPDWRTEWISFDCCLYVPEQERIYCGITSFDADIFYAYDRKSEGFVDCNYKSIRDPYDAKFHRSLVRYQKDGCLYAAVALLHDVDRYWEAPGGAIVRFDPATGKIEKIGIPIPHVYIQSVCLDQNAGILYGQTFTPERLVRFNIPARTGEDLGPIGSGLEMAQGENIELDDDGCAWFAWNVTRAWQRKPGLESNRLCKFDPRKGHINFFNTGLPNPDGSFGFTKVEGIFNLGQEDLFPSGGNGSIYRIDIATGTATYIGMPVSGRQSRLASLRLAPDGFAYGVTGREGHCEVLRFDPKTGKYKLLGEVFDEDSRCWQIHDVAITDDGTMYACENDNPYRSGYLWEIKL